MSKLIKPPLVKIEEDEARNKTIREIENVNTPIARRDFLVFQLNLYDLVMGYKYEKENEDEKNN